MRKLFIACGAAIVSSIGVWSCYREENGAPIILALTIAPYWQKLYEFLLWCQVYMNDSLVKEWLYGRHLQTLPLPIFESKKEILIDYEDNITTNDLFESEQACLNTVFIKYSLV